MALRRKLVRGRITKVFMGKTQTNGTVSNPNLLRHRSRHLFVTFGCANLVVCFCVCEAEDAWVVIRPKLSRVPLDESRVLSPQNNTQNEENANE